MEGLSESNSDAADGANVGASDGGLDGGTVGVRVGGIDGSVLGGSVGSGVGFVGDEVRVCVGDSVDTQAGTGGHGVICSGHPHTELPSDRSVHPQK